MAIRVGQVWASTHRSDTGGFAPHRQRRRVTKWEPPFVWLKTEDVPVTRGGIAKTRTSSRLRARAVGAESWTIPGHRLIEDVAPDA